MFRIGEFSRIGSVTINTLRHYDALGLLKPAKVDPFTGYRYYRQAIAAAQPDRRAERGRFFPEGNCAHFCGSSFIQSGVSVILDLTMGWQFQWERIDDIVRQYPEMSFLPIVLRCPYETCIERTRRRHEAAPEQYDPPEVYETDSKNRKIWEFLARLDRSEVCFVSADRPHEEVYEEVRECVSIVLPDVSCSI